MWLCACVVAYAKCGSARFVVVLFVVCFVCFGVFISMYRAMKGYGGRRRPRRAYAKRSPFQAGALVARSISRGGRMRSNYVKKGTRMGSSVVMQYAKAILNPSLVGGKVPDDFVQPSAAFQLEQEFIVNPLGPQVAMALELGTLPSFGWYGNVSTGSNTGSSKTVLATLGDDFLTSSGTGNGAPGGGQRMLYIGQSTDLTTLLGLYKSCRLVSAGIKVQYSGTDSQNQGVLSIGYLNREWFSHGEEVAAVSNTGTGSTARKTYLTASAADSTTNNYWGLTNADTLDKLAQKIRTLPINAYGPAKDGCFGRYFPLDSNDTEFRQLASATQVGTTYTNKPRYSESNRHVYGNVGAVENVNHPGNNIDYGCFIIVGESLATSSGASFVVKVTCNYEGQVRDEALNLVSTKPSPVQPGAMAKASKIYGKSWQCKVGADVTVRSV